MSPAVDLERLSTKTPVPLSDEEDPYGSRSEPEVVVSGRLKKVSSAIGLSRSRLISCPQLTRTPTEFHIALFDVLVREKRSREGLANGDSSNAQQQCVEYLIPVVKVNLDISDLFLVADLHRKPDL